MNKAMVIKSDWDMNVDLKRLQRECESHPHHFNHIF